MTDPLTGPHRVHPGAVTPVPEWSRPTEEQRTRLGALPTANIADAMQRLGAMDARIKPVWDGATLVGAAYTVWTRPGDNAGIHEALRHVQPGDVLVINGGGDESRALIGELIGGRARARGVAGFVIDGAVRDAPGLAEYDMPVFARGLTPAGPYKDGPYVVAAPTAVGGVVVNPGDVIVADADGVVVIPLAQADAVADLAQAKHDDELRKRHGIDADIAAAEQRHDAKAG